MLADLSVLVGVIIAAVQLAQWKKSHKTIRISEAAFAAWSDFDDLDQLFRRARTSLLLGEVDEATLISALAQSAERAWLPKITEAYKSFAKNVRRVGILTGSNTQSDECLKAVNKFYSEYQSAVHVLPKIMMDHSIVVNNESIVRDMKVDLGVFKPDPKIPTLDENRTRVEQWLKLLINFEGT